MANPGKQKLITEAQNILSTRDFDDSLTRKQSQYEKGMDVANVAERRKLISALKQMAKCDTNFMSFKDDKNFVKHAVETMDELTTYAALSPVLQDMTEDQYDAINLAAGGKLPSLKKMRDKSNAYTYTREYTQAKLDMISNPNYESRETKDYAKKKISELESLKTDAQNRNKVNDVKYYDAHIRMKKAGDLGIKQTYTVEDRLALKTWGNSGRTHHRWRVDVLSLKHKIDLPSREDFKDPEKRWAWFQTLDANSRLTVLKQAQLTEDDVKNGKVQQMKTIEADHLFDSVLEVNKSVVKGSGKGKIAKASYKYKNGIFNFDTNASVGAVNASGKIGAGFKGGKLWEVGAKAQVDASGAAAQGRVKIGLNWDNFGVNAKVSGKVLSGSANAFAGAGRFTYTDEKGNDQDVAGVAAMASAQASLAEATGGIGITICGVKIGASATVQAGGFGGTLGGYANSKGIGGSFGALLGLGFKLNVSIDWGGCGQWWQKRKEKQKIKKAQRAEMNLRNQARRAAKNALKGGVKKEDPKKKGPALKDTNKIKKVPTVKEKDDPEDHNKIVRTTSVNDLKKKLDVDKKEDENNVQRSFTNRLGGPAKRSGGKVNDNRASFGK